MWFYNASLQTTAGHHTTVHLILIGILTRWSLVQPDKLTRCNILNSSTQLRYLGKQDWHLASFLVPGLTKGKEITYGLAMFAEPKEVQELKTGPGSCNTSKNWFCMKGMAQQRETLLFLETQSHQSYASLRFAVESTSHSRVPEFPLMT